MKNTIVRAVGRGYWHGTRGDIRYDIVEPLHAQLYTIYRNKELPAALRQWVLEQMLILKPISGGAFGNTFENDILKLIFNAVNISLVADNTLTTPLTNIAFALHTADPGGAGTMQTSEVAYTNYTRISVSRSGSGLVVSANVVSPAADIVFPTGGGGSGTVTFFSCGPTGGGATKIFMSGTVTPNIVCGNGITPSLTTATTLTLT